MSSLSITVPAFVTVTEPWTTVSFVPGGTPVFVGPGLPGGSGAVGATVGSGFGFGVGVGVGFGFGFGFGLIAGCEAEDEEPVDEAGAVELGVLETDDDVPGSEDTGDDEVAGGTASAEPAFVAGSRSMTAATMSPPSSTSTSVTTTTRSRTEPGSGMAIRSP
jgi:hypothetical protein